MAHRFVILFCVQALHLQNINSQCLNRLLNGFTIKDGIAQQNTNVFTNLDEMTKSSSVPTFNPSFPFSQSFGPPTNINKEPTDCSINSQVPIDSISNFNQASTINSECPFSQPFSNTMSTPNQLSSLERPPNFNPFTADAPLNDMSAFGPLSTGNSMSSLSSPIQNDMSAFGPLSTCNSMSSLSSPIQNEMSAFGPLSTCNSMSSLGSPIQNELSAFGPPLSPSMQQSLFDQLSSSNQLSTVNSVPSSPHTINEVTFGNSKLSANYDPMLADSQLPTANSGNSMNCLQSNEFSTFGSQSSIDSVSSPSVNRLTTIDLCPCGNQLSSFNPATSILNELIATGSLPTFNPVSPCNQVPVCQPNIIPIPACYPVVPIIPLGVNSLPLYPFVGSYDQLSPINQLSPFDQISSVDQVCSSYNFNPFAPVSPFSSVIEEATVETPFNPMSFGSVCRSCPSYLPPPCVSDDAVYPGFFPPGYPFVPVTRIQDNAVTKNLVDTMQLMIVGNLLGGSLPNTELLAANPLSAPFRYYM